MPLQGWQSTKPTVFQTLLEPCWGFRAALTVTGGWLGAHQGSTLELLAAVQGVTVLQQAHIICTDSASVMLGLALASVVLQVP